MKRIVVVSLVLVASVTLVSGFSAADSFGLFGAYSMPSGDFGDDSGSGAGLAKSGFGFGIEYSTPLGSPGLELMMSSSLLVNGLDADAMEDELRDEFSGSDIEVEYVEAGSYLNIPIMGGVRYLTPVSPMVDLFGIGLVGLNVLMVPEIQADLMVWDDTANEYKRAYLEQNHDPATSFGMGLGGGVIVNKRMSIGFRYYSLGKPEINGEMDIDVYGVRSEHSDVKFDQSVSVFLITAGLTF
jgi:hypothetical protein